MSKTYRDEQVHPHTIKTPLAPQASLFNWCVSWSKC